MKKFTRILLLFFTLAASSIHAADFSFTGNLSNDDEVQLFNITVTTASTVTFRTWSYAGGTNADGTVIAPGGFDPILSVFDSTGAPIQDNDDGGSNVPAGPVTGSNFDTFLTLTLAPGNYTVAVSQYDNRHGATLSDPFSGSGTAGFRDVNGATRTGAWAFDALNVGSVVAPPPVVVVVSPPVVPTDVPTLSQWSLMLLSLLLFSIGFKSRKQN